MTMKCGAVLPYVRSMGELVGFQSYIVFSCIVGSLCPAVSCWSEVLNLDVSTTGGEVVIYLRNSVWKSLIFLALRL